jgi:hypothetical protein
VPSAEFPFFWMMHRIEKGTVELHAARAQYVVANFTRSPGPAGAIRQRFQTALLVAVEDLVTYLIDVD